LMCASKQGVCGWLLTSIELGSIPRRTAKQISGNAPGRRHALQASPEGLDTLILHQIFSRWANWQVACFGSRKITVRVGGARPGLWEPIPAGAGHRLENGWIAEAIAGRH